MYRKTCAKCWIRGKKPSNSGLRRSWLVEVQSRRNALTDVDCENEDIPKRIREEARRAGIKHSAFCSLTDPSIVDFQNLETRWARSTSLHGNSSKMASSSSGTVKTAEGLD